MFRTLIALVACLPAAVSAADFDADGRADLAVGAVADQDDTGTLVGAVFTFTGEPSGKLRFRTKLSGIGEAQSRQVFGSSIAFGDVTGDARDDLVVGMEGSSRGSTEGRPGELNLFVAQPDGTFLARQRLVMFVTERQRAGLPSLMGRSVAVGDFNGDGHLDIAAGAPTHPRDGQNRTSGSGAVFIFRRNPNANVDGEQPLFLSGQPVDQREIGENEPGDRFGAAVATGRVNRDAVADLIVGAPRDHVRGVSTGSVFLFVGTTGSLTPAFRLGQGSLDSDESGDRFGASLAVADFDGDGQLDLAVGAPGESTDRVPQAGAVYVFRGSQMRPRLDPFQAIRNPGQNLLDASDHFGRSLAAGDFNGDGLFDLAVGAPNDRSFNPLRAPDRLVDLRPRDDRPLDTGVPRLPGLDSPIEAPRPRFHPRGGTVSVYHGTEDGLRFAQTLARPFGEIEQGDMFGSALSAGDFNGDGRDDLAVGALGVGEPNARPGAVFVFQTDEVGRLQPVHQLGERSEDAFDGEQFGATLSR